MRETDTPNHEGPKPLLEQETLPTGTITWIGIGALAVFALGIFASNLLLTSQTVRALATGQPELPKEIGQPEIGIVDQQHFELEHRDKDEKRAQLRRLDSYGWVDRQKGIVHIPVEEAMRQVLSEQGK